MRDNVRIPLCPAGAAPVHSSPAPPQSQSQSTTAAMTPNVMPSTLAHQLTHVHLHSNPVQFNGQMSPICGLSAAAASLLTGSRASPVTPNSTHSKSPTIRATNNYNHHQHPHHHHHHHHHLHNLPHLQDDDSEDESEIMEESPCGRWWKRREEVQQQAIPGLDGSFLAMDTEEGVEVVWNEVRFSERRWLQTNATRLDRAFGRLVQLRHPNIVRLHEYWLDREPPRVVFITEHMASGSLRMFLKKTKKSVGKMGLCAWRRWCTQMLCALSYLHGQSPPIIHGNLTCDSVFIAHNGLIKIGAVAPDAIRQTVKSVCINGLNNMHTLAPELAGDITPAVGSSLPIVSSNGLAVSSPGASTVIGQACPATDIYAFGVVALEMALLGFASNTRSDSERLTSSASSPSLANSSSISPLPPSTLLQSNWSRESLLQMLQQLEMPLQREFISGCLSTDPHQRPTARSLLFHPLVFQVPSLQLLCAHRIISSDSPYSAPETLAEELQKRRRTSNKPVAQIPCINGQARSLTPTDLSRCNSEHVEQLVEEVRDGVHPMYAFEKRKLIRTCSSQLFEVSSQVSDGTHTTVRSSESRQSNVPDGTSDSRCRFDSMRSEQSIGVFYANSNQFETSLPQSDGAVALDAALYDSAESLSVAFETCTHCAEPTYTVESRRIVQIEVLVQHATAAATDNPHSQPMLSVRLRLDDQMNRQLSCELSELDSPMTMAQELVYYGFIHPDDLNLLCQHIHEALCTQLTGSCCTNPGCCSSASHNESIDLNACTESSSASASSSSTTSSASSSSCPTLILNGSDAVADDTRTSGTLVPQITIESCPK